MSMFVVVLLSACVGFLLGVVFMAMCAASGIADEQAERQRLSPRKDLVEAWQDMTTLLCALDGQAPEMTDKAAIRAMARAIWLILDWIVRRIDKESKHE